MTGPKIKAVKSMPTPPVSRDGLEGFIWAATGWRGAPEVIDSILARVDQYTTARCREVADGPPAKVDELQAEVVELSAELNAVRAEKSGLAAQLEARPAVSTVERIAIGELLDLLASAVLEATGARSSTDRALAALASVSDALRAADGKVKDITLSNRVAERRTDPEFRERLADAVEQNAAALGRLASGAAVEREAYDRRQFPQDWEGAPAQTVRLEIATDGDAQVARALGAKIVPAAVPGTAAPQAVADRLMEEEAAEIEQQWADLMGAGVGQIEADGPEPGPEPVAELVPEPEEEDDPEMAAMIAEIEAELLATGKGARCAKCSQVKVWENFYKDKQAANGHKGACKQCEARHIRERKAAARVAAQAAAAILESDRPLG